MTASRARARWSRAGAGAGERRMLGRLVEGVPGQPHLAVAGVQHGQLHRRLRVVRRGGERRFQAGDLGAQAVVDVEQRAPGASAPPTPRRHQDDGVGHGGDRAERRRPLEVIDRRPVAELGRDRDQRVHDELERDLEQPTEDERPPQGPRQAGHPGAGERQRQPQAAADQVARERHPPELAVRQAAGHRHGPLDQAVVEPEHPAADHASADDVAHLVDQHDDRRDDEDPGLGGQPAVLDGEVGVPERPPAAGDQ